MGSKRLNRLSAIDIMNLHGLMKDYVVLCDRIDDVQYADYKPGWDDDRMARFARESMGRYVSAIQVRNLRQALFGVMRKPPSRPMPEPGLTGQPVGAHIRALEAAFAATVKELREYHAHKYNELLDYVRKLDARVWALDAEWSTCRPAGYKPGLPEIINDTKDAL